MIHPDQLEKWLSTYTVEERLKQMRDQANEALRSYRSREKANGVSRSHFESGGGFVVSSGRGHGRGAKNSAHNTIVARQSNAIDRYRVAIEDLRIMVRTFDGIDLK